MATYIDWLRNIFPCPYAGTEPGACNAPHNVSPDNNDGKGNYVCAEKHSEADPRIISVVLGRTFACRFVSQSECNATVVRWIKQSLRETKRRTTETRQI